MILPNSKLGARKSSRSRASANLYQRRAAPGGREGSLRRFVARVFVARGGGDCTSPAGSSTGLQDSGHHYHAASIVVPPLSQCALPARGERIACHSVSTRISSREAFFQKVPGAASASSDLKPAPQQQGSSRHRGDTSKGVQLGCGAKAATSLGCWYRRHSDEKGRSTVDGIRAAGLRTQRALPAAVQEVRSRQRRGIRRGRYPWRRTRAVFRRRRRASSVGIFVRHRGTFQ